MCSNILNESNNHVIYCLKKSYKIPNIAHEIYIFSTMPKKHNFDICFWHVSQSNSNIET